jgi:hypothetical protein
MKGLKKYIESFKNEMGFKYCNLNPSEVSENDLIFVRNMEKVEGDCNNIKGDTYHCTAYIGANKDKIIKSDCIKKD